MSSESTALVHIDFRQPQFNEEFDEFVQLAISSGLEVQATITGKRDMPSVKYFIGSGKLDEIKQSILNSNIDVVIFNHSLSPAQARNLECELNCRVLDRIELILDIFAQRARSYEGRLQVELAQLQHLSTRLVRGWTHLERQKGGVGLRGPGETQLETDRRLLGKRIRVINSHLLKVKRQRYQGRKLRKRTSTSVVSLVGYTNAGKSTLYNKLTGAGAYVSDKLFATLDTTLRKMKLFPGKQIILSDTVGFIRHIPHDLIDAFHATLEEVKEADLLLHVVDVNDPHKQSRIHQVNTVIKEIGAAKVPQILVFNKIDLKKEIEVRTCKYDASLPQVWLSARNGRGIVELKAIINEQLKPARSLHVLHLPPTASKLRAKLFQCGTVHEEKLDENGSLVISINIDHFSLQKLCKTHGLEQAMIR